MKLHLVRHAKTLQALPDEHDFDRALAEHGKRQAASLGEYLKEKIPNCEVWCSQARRTRETFDILEKAGNSFRTITYFKDFYLCSKDAFLEKLWMDNSTEDVMIIGHNFGISELANYFLDDMLEMRTCEYICIEFETHQRNETSQDRGFIADRWKYDK